MHHLMLYHEYNFTRINNISMTNCFWLFYLFSHSLSLNINDFNYLLVEQTICIVCKFLRFKTIFLLEVLFVIMIMLFLFAFFSLVHFLIYFSFSKALLPYIVYFHILSSYVLFDLFFYCFQLL